MALVYVSANREPDDDVLDAAPFARIFHGGVYYFLYPQILALRDATGELIDPQQDAFFSGESLDALERFVAIGTELANAQDPTWEQRVATTLPAREVVNQTTARHDVLALLGHLSDAVRSARTQDAGVLFLGQ